MFAKCLWKNVYQVINEKAMPNKKITELPVATTPTGPELVEIVQGGVNKQSTLQAIADLAGDEHFKGVFASEAALQAAFPSAAAGDYALVDTGGSTAQLFIWDNTDSDWVASGVTTIVPDASETVKGIAELATQAETTTGTDDLRIVTPLKARGTYPSGLAAVDTTGTAIQFDVPKTYGSVATPETGNVTLNSTGLVKGMVQLLLHNNASVAPTFGSEFARIGGNYVTNVLNSIYFHAVSATRIEYTINQTL